MNDGFFPPKPEISPKIYAYRDTNPSYDGLLKVGFKVVFNGVKLHADLR